jgi:membrane protein DedA with SNARE-associated domain
LEAFLDSVVAWNWLVYGLIFLALFIESLGLPIPGLTVALVGAALAGQAKLEIWLVVGLTLLGGVLGGLGGYWLGRTGGRRFLERWGKYILITPDRLEMGERYFHRYGAKILLVGRYLPVLCFGSGLLSGLTRLPYRRFFLYNILSIALWEATHLTLAYIFGRNLDALMEIVNNVGLGMGLFVALLIGLFIFLKLKQRRSRRVKIAPKNIRPQADN